jgi:hypothetical protein
MKQKFTTSYHPASNGETERFNRTLTTMLKKELVDGAHSNKEDLLDLLLFAYRSSIHSSTKESPYYIVQGRDPNIPINKFLEAAPKTDKSPSDYVGELVNRLRYSFQRVAEESGKARERQRAQYNKRANENEYKVGDKVLLDIRVVKTGDSKKFTSKYKGPYRIIKVYANKTVDIADSSYVTQRVHVNRVKPLFETMLWRQEPCPAFESTFDVGNWYRATTETDTQTAKDPNENAQRAKSNSSATCATSGDKENESDWETCSDCSTDSDNETNKIIRGKEDVREDVTEMLQENTNEEETIQPAEIGVEPPTSASPNKVKKKVGRPKKSAHPVNPSTSPAQTEQVAKNPNPPNPTHHPPTDTTNGNSNENSTPGNKTEQLGKRIRRRPVRYADGADENQLDQLDMDKDAKKIRKNPIGRRKTKKLYKY